MIDKFNIPLDEYPRRCIKQIAEWEEERNNILKDGKSPMNVPGNMLLTSWRRW